MSATQTQTRKSNQQWCLYRDLIDEAHGISVRIWKLDSFRPRFRYQIGGVVGNEFRPSIQPQVTVENYSVNLRPTNTEAMCRLVAQAEHIVFEASQEREDSIQTQKAFREQRSVVKDSSSVGKGLSRFTHGTKNINK